MTFNSKKFRNHCKPFLAVKSRISANHAITVTTFAHFAHHLQPVPQTRANPGHGVSASHKLPGKMASSHPHVLNIHPHLASPEPPLTPHPSIAHNFLPKHKQIAHRTIRRTDERMNASGEEKTIKSNNFQCASRAALRERGKESLTVRQPLCKHFHTRRVKWGKSGRFLNISHSTQNNFSRCHGGSNTNQERDFHVQYHTEQLRL